MNQKPGSFEEYLAGLSQDKRTALEALRQTIKSIIPAAEEIISYQLPTFRLNGKKLVAMGAAAGHCALYPLSAATVEAHRSELSEYSTSKGTIRFQPDAPLPEALVRKLVSYRIAETGTEPCRD